MHTRLYNRITNLFLPCLVFSAITGFFTAILTTEFKLLAELVIHASTSVYSAVRENPFWLPILVASAAAIGLAAAFMRSLSHSIRGGGIPTSVAAIRGIFSFKWIPAILLLPIAALLTFLAGLPLGNEGPCVQMGTAVGDGVTKLIGSKKYKGWRRYIMTGGASAGFSIATASPISAIMFSIEELHKRFSPMLLSVASMSIAFAQITSLALDYMGLPAMKLFEISEIPSISLTLFFAPIIIGLATGFFSIIFTHLYHISDRIMHKALKKLKPMVVFPLLFALTAIIGFLLTSGIGTGHSLVASLLNGRSAWYLLILLLLIRAIAMMMANTSGATGGIFLPTLAFGAIVGALCADGMIALGWIGDEHYTLMVVLGVTSFLGSTSRIPLTACIFAVEAFGGINNIIPIVISATVSLLIVESSGIEDLTDTLIEMKVHKITNGKKPVSVEVPLTVKEESFVFGKEIHDILWPNQCVVVSFNRVDKSKKGLGLAAGDIITVHYNTYDAKETADELIMLVGEQSAETLDIMIPAN